MRSLKNTRHKNPTTHATLPNMHPYHNTHNHVHHTHHKNATQWLSAQSAKPQNHQQKPLRSPNETPNKPLNTTPTNHQHFPTKSTHNPLIISKNIFLFFPNKSADYKLRPQKPISPKATWETMRPSAARPYTLHRLFLQFYANKRFRRAAFTLIPPSYPLVICLLCPFLHS